MGSRFLSLFPLAVSVTALALSGPARSEEPSPRELIALAPVLDSSGRACKSLEVGGWVGSDQAAAPKLTFHAFYRAPNQFSLLVSDAHDGTPLAYCSGKKMFVYDPVGPTLYYSEDAGFKLDLASNGVESMKFNVDYQLVTQRPDHILVDLRSVLSSKGWLVAGGPAARDMVVKRNVAEFRLIRGYEDTPVLTVNIDQAKDCPYTEVTFACNGITYMCLDRLALNDSQNDEPFGFPSKHSLIQALPVREVAAGGKSGDNGNISAVIERAAFARAVVNSASPPGPLDLPGPLLVNWDRVRENDKKYSKVLRGLVPRSRRTQ